MRQIFELRKNKRALALRGKAAGTPNKELVADTKTFAVMVIRPIDYHLRIVKIDRLIQDLLQEGIFRKALPNLTYGQFEVSEDVHEHFKMLCSNHGLETMEVRA